MYCSSTATISMKRCTIRLELRWCASTWSRDRTLSTSSVKGNSKDFIGNKMRWKKCSCRSFQHWAIFKGLDLRIETSNRPTCFCCQASSWNLLISESQKTTFAMRTMVAAVPWRRLEERRSTCHRCCGERMLKKGETLGTPNTIFSSLTCSAVDSSCSSLHQWRT